MKATHTAEYFSKYSEDLFKKYRKECDYEYSLKHLVPDFETLPEDMREKAEATVKKMYAKKVADEATAALKKKMHTIQEIKAGRAGLGYTTVTQEISAWHELNEGFEFACYMLAQFKKKYSLS